MPDEAVFCMGCGVRIHSTQELPETVEGENTPKRWPKPLIVMVLVIVIGGVSLAIARLLDEERRQIKPYPPSIGTVVSTFVPTPKPTPQWEKGSHQVGTEALALRPGYIHWFPFEVPGDWRNVRLKGRFQAQGGSGNDVQIVVTDEDGLTNFRNRHGFRSWYNSQKTTVDSVNIQLPPGQFYLVISNSFSVFAHKSVTMNFQLNYEWLKHP